VETKRANRLNRITFWHYDTIAGRAPLQINIQIKHQESVIQYVAGKNKSFARLVAHDFQDKTICSTTVIQKPRSV
jgi:hypothetical protein